MVMDHDSIVVQPSSSSAVVAVRNRSSKSSSSSASSQSSVEHVSVNENATESVECLYGQKFETLHSQCLAEGKLFEDPHFLTHNDLLRERSKIHIDDIEWKRPHEILQSYEVQKLMLEMNVRDDVISEVTSSDEEGGEGRRDESLSRFQSRMKNKTPILVSDKNEGFVFRPGLDSWFVPAFVVLSESESLLYQVIPVDQCFDNAEGMTKEMRNRGMKSYVGMFHFRLWFGRWIDIVIDDRIPTLNSIPLYLRSANIREMWPALLEKAYAKAKGSFELLNRWMAIDGLIELTGGVPERVHNSPGLKSLDEDIMCFNDMRRAMAHNNVIIATCPTKRSPEDRDRSLKASSLGLDVKVVYRVVQLVKSNSSNIYDEWMLRLINVSGPESTFSSADPKNQNSSSNQKFEVRSSKILSPQVMERIRDSLMFNVTQDHENSTVINGFWMAYGDFISCFKTIDLCHLNHETDHLVTFHGRWEVGLNAGGTQKAEFSSYSKNPQCFVRLDGSGGNDGQSGETNAVISLMQRRKVDSKSKGRNKIGFKIFRVDDDVNELTTSFFAYVRPHDSFHKCITKTATWSDSRETNIRVRLPPAKYAIIPSTYLPDMEGDFILRVHIESTEAGIVEQGHRPMLTMSQVD